MSFCNNLKTIREQKGMTQKELAAILNLSTASVIAYEQAQKKPSFDVLMAIAEKLNVSLDVLCGVEILPRTWSDYARHIVALDYANRSHGCIEFKCLAGDSCAIVFNALVADLQEEGWAYADVITDDQPCGGYGGYEENPLAKFTNEFIKMRDLHFSGAIDDELFSMWLTKTYKSLDRPISAIND